MNDRIIRPAKHDDSQTLAIQFREGAAIAVTANQLAAQAIENFHAGLGGFIAARDAEDAMLPGRSYDDAVLGMTFARDVAGSGLNVSTQKPGLRARVFMEEFGILRNSGYFGEDVIFNVHDDDSVRNVMKRLESVIMNPTGCVGLKGQARKIAIQQHIQNVADAAPNLFLFAELIKQSEVIITQQFTQLYARTLFPVLNLSTWLETWMYRRRSRGATRPAQSVDLSASAKRASRNNSEQTVPVARPLRFYQAGAAWNQMEIWRLAEAVANGMPTWNIVAERTEDAIASLMLSEDNLAFFGDPAAISNGIVGLLSPSAQTGITHTPAVTAFGAGDPETDRQLLIQASSSIVLQTEKIYSPNTLAVGTATWLYLTETRYGDLSNPSDRLVIDVAMDTLTKRGINEISWIPALGFRPDLRDQYLAQGLDATESQRLAGGIAGLHCMATFRKDPKVIELVVGKDVTPYPTQAEVLGETEVRYVIGAGGLAIYQPAACRITTAVGPTP